jgi:predicted PurR-regulated permease PerM
VHPIDRLRETRLLPVLVAIGAVAFAIFITKVWSVLPPFLWAAVTAYLLFPLVARIERTLRLPRVAVVGGLYLTFIATLVTLSIVLGPTISSQTKDLAESLPDQVREARAELIKNPEIKIGGMTFDTRQLDQQIDDFVQSVTDRVTEKAPSLVLETLDIAIKTLIYFLCTFYFLLHGDKMLSSLRSLAPRRHRHVLDRVGRQVNATFGAYVRGQLILFTIMSVSTFIVLTVLDVDFALALAVSTGVLELVPLIGPWLAAIIGVTVALSQGHAPFGWSQVQLGVVVGLAYFLLRQLEDHIIIPQLIGRIVRIHPVLVVFAVLAGAHLFGMLGLLLAVPMTAAFKIILQSLYYELSNPPNRRVVPVKSSGELAAARSEFEDTERGHVVLLIGPGAISWDDLPVLQQLAMLAVGHDITLSVVTADAFAASLATAAGIRVVTEARFSDEVGMAESLIEEHQRTQRRRRRFMFRASDGADVETRPALDAEVATASRTD